MKNFAFFIIGFIVCANSYAQTKVQGKVIAPDGSPIPEVIVAIDNSPEIESNNQGRFEYIMPSEKEYPEKVEAKKKGFKLQNWGYDRNKKRLQILMWPAGEPLGGKVVDLNNRPIPNVSVVLSGVNSDAPVFTDKNGNFVIETPASFKMQDKSKFIVDGIYINPEEYSYNAIANTVTIHFRHRNQNNTSRPAVPPTANSEKNFMDENLEEKIKTALNPTLVVVVYDDDLTPVKNKTVYVNNRQHTTDEKGEFKIVSQGLDTSDFYIDSYNIIRKEYDVFGNYVYLYVQDPAKATVELPIDSIGFQYDQNFNFVFNQLESEKQMLQEHGAELRKEIEIINQKLKRESATMSVEKRRALQEYVKRLESALIENDLAYEAVQKKTKMMIDKMKETIVHKDSIIIKEKEQIEESERKLKFLTLELEALAVIAVLLVGFGYVYYRNYQKIRKQHQELEKAHQEIKKAKDEIEHANQDILAMRDIGRELTSQLDFHALANFVYSHISKLFPVEIFGIALYDEAKRTLHYKDFIKQGVFQPSFEEKIDDKNCLAGWCINNNKELIINNTHEEIQKYLPHHTLTLSDFPQSVCFIPLIDKDKITGIFTVQSYQSNAYHGIDMQILRILSSYLSVAISNAKIYEEVKLSKQKITDSIRYAQTIQQAVLPSIESIQKRFSDYFIIYKPKDIVSGDFYWFSYLESHQIAVLAVADCTGHGVSGAFMSMIGNTLLNEIINQKYVLDSAQVLTLMNKGIISALKQEAKMNDDGMDIGICIFHYSNGAEIKVEFSGAKRPLYIIKKGTKTIETYKGDNKSVGGIFKTAKQFTKHELFVQEGDRLYLTTDGFTHQNDVEHNKIGSNYLKKLLEESVHLSMKQQAAHLLAALDEHMKGTEQRDDITLLGVQI
ncbi:MAG: SpoIIE family protein phosphatase [Cytophagales bacterium]|nr:SpoIIE family protein phosphatase [Cytophagales bacterium]MDW8383928.1 SpoIIE family protein phosphatase [Flammeovirgaceae bacterium]